MHPQCFCCLGDSITSDQVTGIGTVVAHKLNAACLLNAAVGYATCSDWHDGDQNITPLSLVEPPNTNTADNVLSNQVRRVLQAITPEGEPVVWTVSGRTYTFDAKGTGQIPVPDVIYIAISTNDGNQPFNAVQDDFEAVARQSYDALTRNSLASGLRWAVETLKAACQGARIFVATPLQTCTDLPWMVYESGMLKRKLVMQVCGLCGAECIDSFVESGFEGENARLHGGVHPDEEWKERIACYVAGEIEKRLK